jgi:hypothetical protein
MNPSKIAGGKVQVSAQRGVVTVGKPPVPPPARWQWLDTLLAAFAAWSA